MSVVGKWPRRFELDRGSARSAGSRAWFDYLRRPTFPPEQRRRAERAVCEVVKSNAKQIRAGKSQRPSGARTTVFPCSTICAGPRFTRSVLERWTSIAEKSEQPVSMVTTINYTKYISICLFAIQSGRDGQDFLRRKLEFCISNPFIANKYPLFEWYFNNFCENAIYYT